MKTIDVVVPSFNRLVYLIDTVKSILEQTYKINKIIIVDDNSKFTENDFWNKVHLNDLPTENIIFYKKKNNLGACHSRNLGASLSSAEFIAFLDDDDLWERDHISSLMECFIDEKVVLSYSGKKIKNYKKNKIRNSLNIIPSSNQYESLIRCNYPGSTSSIVVRKKHFLSAGGFDESLPAIQDYDFYLRLVKEGKIATNGMYTLIYRDDTAVKITNQLDKARDAFFKIVQKPDVKYTPILAKTIFIQNLKKAILNKKINYIYFFAKDYLQVLLKSK
ncbi:glycosyl transferase family 2 [Rahnella sp. BIGb0236]|uniref:glycosyltransferase family 2 protein n=1 Tax=Rahnella sp. BIGb0236 TaxID=2485117 RepID=UPI00105C9D92|nr:glycosyltransferase family A protein [Rahnella sp. BIGb0236]TDS88339.1 glycosyl transferase family 2 [Rahnella sp. BIGb0236]VTQ62318.1 glucosyl transferase [Campylobacter jejuni]